MNAERVFVDANVLVYAHDRGAGGKHERAKGIVRDCWASGIPANLSVQVLQEVHVTLLRKGLPMADSAAIVEDYLRWNVVENRIALLREALVVQGEFGLSFWDASIVAAALASGAEELWSEDFQAGRIYRGLRVVNPFAGVSGDLG